MGKVSPLHQRQNALW